MGAFVVIKEVILSKNKLSNSFVMTRVLIRGCLIGFAWHTATRSLNPRTHGCHCTTIFLGYYT